MDAHPGDFDTAPVVVLALDAPLQSWGEVAGFSSERPTGAMPTLSGVTGMVANALGLARGELGDGLAQASMWSRADRPGVRLRDFHTVAGHQMGSQADEDGVLRHKTGKPVHVTLPTERWYLADAAFVAAWAPGPGLTAEDAAAALRRPARPLYLGRRSCPPAAPVLLGVSETDRRGGLLERLPLLRDRPDDDSPVTVTHQTPDIGEGWDTMLADRPVTFDPAERWRAGYRTRQVSTRPIVHAASRCAGRGTAGRRAIMREIEAEAA